MKKTLILAISALILLGPAAAGAAHWLADRALVPGNTFRGSSNFDPGTTPLSSLAVGTRVKDTTWTWEGEPVTWIVVGKDHYGEGTGVLLLSERVLKEGIYANAYGDNSWDGANIIKPWLNGYFYEEVISANFRGAIKETTIPYTRYFGSQGQLDQTGPFNIFILSGTELGTELVGSGYMRVGETAEYFKENASEKRRSNAGYWTRTPDLFNSGSHVIALGGGEWRAVVKGTQTGYGYRPALCLKASTPVKPEAVNGVYEIKWRQP